MAVGAHRPCLVLDGQERQSLLSVRRLGPRGVTVFVAEGGEGVPASVSRWCAGRAVLPDVGQGADAYIDALIELCRTIGTPVIVPSHDGVIEALRARRPDVDAVGRLALGSNRALATVVEKEASLEMARELGFHVPVGRTVISADDAPQAVVEIGLPMVIKPAFSWVATGAGGWRSGPVVVRDMPSAIAHIRRFTDAGTAALVQQWLPGHRDAIGIVVVGDEVIAKFAVRTHRMAPMIGGCSVLRETIPLASDISGIAEALVRRAGLEGYAEVEFRRDAAGRPFLMEVTPRLNAGIEVAVRAGVDVPWMLYRWASGELVEPVTYYRCGVRMRWLQGDVRWLLEALQDPGQPDSPGRRGALRGFFGAFGTRTGYDYWDRHDLRPVAREARRLAGRMAGMVRR